MRVETFFAFGRAQSIGPMVMGVREGACSTQVSCDLVKSQDDDGLLGGYHLTGCMSSTKIPSPIGEFQAGDDGTARRAGARVSKSREALAPPLE